jgi:hypothetical protein
MDFDHESFEFLGLRLNRRKARSRKLDFARLGKLSGNSNEFSNGKAKSA